MRLGSRRVSLAIRWLRDRVLRLIERTKILVLRAIKGPSEGWMSVVLLLLLLLMAAWSAASALSVPPGFYGVLISGVLVALILAKTRISWSVLLAVGVFAGLILVFSQITRLAEGTAVIDRYSEVGARLLSAWQALLGRDLIRDALPSAFILLSAAWLTGFISSWLLFRIRNIWGALLPSAIIMVALYLTLLRGEQLLRVYLYLTLAFLLAAQLFNSERQHRWDSRGIQRYPRYSKLRLHGALGLSIVAMLVTSLLPIQPARVEPIAAAWDRLTAPAIVVLEEGFSRVFLGGPGEESYSSHYFGPTRVFGGGRDLGEEPVLIVWEPMNVYLPVRSYDVYTAQGWKSSDTQRILPAQLSRHTIETQLLKTQEVRVSVTSLSSVWQGQPMPVGSYPIDMSIDHRLEVRQPARYHIPVKESEPLHQSAGAGFLPADLRQAVHRLYELGTSLDSPLSEVEIRAILPDDFEVVYWEREGQRITEVVVERLVSMHDVVSVRAARSLAAGNSFQATVVVSTATESDLLTAGTDYPGWVLDRYIQFPGDTPSRVTDLARELTADAETPYEMAVAVRDYLRTLDYDLNIEPPPGDADGVDHFLFELEEGYCQYFASAMAVLLRSSGVPTRMVVGYGPGDVVDGYIPPELADLQLPDDATTEHLFPGSQHPKPMLIVRDSHAWCEVFFPSYGWIPFEPTPGYAIMTREEPAQLPDYEQHSGFVPERPDQGSILPGGPIETTPRETPSSQRGTQVHMLPLAVTTGLVALGLALWLAWRRLFREMTEPRLAYSRTGYLAALSGLGPQDNLTPYEYGSRLTAAMPEVSVPVERIVNTYVRSCYTKHRVTNEDRLQIAEAWPQVRNHLLRRILQGLLPVKLRSGN